MDYNSNFTDKPVKPAQKIVEIVCERAALKLNKMQLPKRFWNDERFSRNYRLQLIKANALLKIYSAEAIIKALQSPKGSSVYSLNCKWLDGLVALEQKKLEVAERKRLEYEELQQKQEVTKVIDKEKVGAAEPEFLKKTESLLDKLDG